jgi:hypothetical protein
MSLGSTTIFSLVDSFVMVVVVVVVVVFEVAVPRAGSFDAADTASKDKCRVAALASPSEVLGAAAVGAVGTTGQLVSRTLTAVASNSTRMCKGSVLHGPTTTPSAPTATSVRNSRGREKESLWAAATALALALASVPWSTIGTFDFTTSPA